MSLLSEILEYAMEQTLANLPEFSTSMEMNNDKLTSDYVRSQTRYLISEKLCTHFTETIFGATNSNTIENWLKEAYLDFKIKRFNDDNDDADKDDEKKEENYPIKSNIKSDSKPAFNKLDRTTITERSVLKQDIKREFFDAIATPIISLQNKYVEFSSEKYLNFALTDNVLKIVRKNAKEELSATIKRQNRLCYLILLCFLVLLIAICILTIVNVFDGFAEYYSQSDFEETIGTLTVIALLVCCCGGRKINKNLKERRLAIQGKVPTQLIKFLTSDTKKMGAYMDLKSMDRKFLKQSNDFSIEQIVMGSIQKQTLTSYLDELDSDIASNIVTTIITHLYKPATARLILQALPFASDGRLLPLDPLIQEKITSGRVTFSALKMHPFFIKLGRKEENNSKQDDSIRAPLLPTSRTVSSSRRYDSLEIMMT